MAVVPVWRGLAPAVDRVVGFHDHQTQPGPFIARRTSSLSRVQLRPWTFRQHASCAAPLHRSTFARLLDPSWRHPRSSWCPGRPHRSRPRERRRPRSRGPGPSPSSWGLSGQLHQRHLGLSRLAHIRRTLVPLVLVFRCTLVRYRRRVVPPPFVRALRVDHVWLALALRVCPEERRRRGRVCGRRGGRA